LGLRFGTKNPARGQVLVVVALSLVGVAEVHDVILERLWIAGHRSRNLRDRPLGVGRQKPKIEDERGLVCGQAVKAGRLNIGIHDRPLCRSFLRKGRGVSGILERLETFLQISHGCHQKKQFALRHSRRLSIAGEELKRILHKAAAYLQITGFLFNPGGDVAGREGYNLFNHSRYSF